MQENKYRHTIFYLLVLLVVLLISWWPVTFYAYSLKNDALNYFLPVRRLVSESFYHHMLPLWTPYLNMGYPLHGDMQSGVWNPFVQVLSLSGPYTLRTLQLETLLYVYLSGCGMFFLMKYFRVHPFSNLLASVAYMLCGFNTDCSEFLNWIAGASFLPFLFLFYHRFLQERSGRAAVYTGASAFFIFTCAYPADFIIAGYLLLAMLTGHLVIKYRETKNLRAIDKKLLAGHFIILVVFLALSAPAILSYVRSLPLTERGSGASYADVMSNPLHPLLVSSYTTPLAIWRMPHVSDTDALERNSYMGIVGFVFLLCSFMVPPTSGITRFSRYAAIIFFIFSLGESGLLRIACYYMLPLMDTFRHPANAKVFTIFFSCMLAAFTFDAWRKHKIPASALKKAIALTALLATGVLLWSLFSAPLFSPAADLQPSKPQLGQYLKSLILQLNFPRIVLLTTLVQIPFLYLSWRWLIKSSRPLYMLQLAVVNSVIFCMLAQPFTVVKNEKAAVIQNLIDSNAIDGYPIPHLQSTIRENSIDGMKYFPEIGVLNLYNKKIGRVDYRISPSNLLSQNEFWSQKAFRETLLDYPLMYQTEQLTQENSKKTFAPVASNADIHIIKWLPNDFEFTVNNAAPGHYVLLQNFFPCWTVVTDGKITEPEKINLSFMGFTLPAGAHNVAFHYSVPGLRTSFAISSLLLASLLLYSLFAVTKPAIRNFF